MGSSPSVEWKRMSKVCSFEVIVALSAPAVSVRLSGVQLDALATGAGFPWGKRGKWGPLSWAPFQWVLVTEMTSSKTYSRSWPETIS